MSEMYSGLIPVKDNASRALFFVWQPTVGKSVDEVTIWLNGGPGTLQKQSPGDFY
jgi:carboxypeptidase D